jgi:hypothetical protein
MACSRPDARRLRDVFGDGRSAHRRSRRPASLRSPAATRTSVPWRARRPATWASRRMLTPRSRMDIRCIQLIAYEINGHTYLGIT